jgi:hypothetical protein
MTDPEQDKLKHNSAGSRIGQPQAGPSDVGEGKLQGRSFHKPNEKHTLDEVLKSLQDLIHNDLLRDPNPPPTISAAPAPETSASPAPAADPASPDAAPPGADVPFEAVVASLEQLVTRELATNHDDRSEPAAEMPTPDMEPTPAETPEVAPAERTETGQQTFAFDDSATGAINSPAAETPQDTPLEAEAPAPEPEVEEISLDAADVPVLNEPVLDTAAPPAADLDGIPVLEDVALASDPTDPIDTLIGRVLERFNDERRARGEPELDSTTGDALRALLRDELAQRSSEK